MRSKRGECQERIISGEAIAGGGAMAIFDAPL
jgi:hypothetical protein